MRELSAGIELQLVVATSPGRTDLISSVDQQRTQATVAQAERHRDAGWTRADDYDLILRYFVLDEPKRTPPATQSRILLHRFPALNPTMLRRNRFSGDVRRPQPLRRAPIPGGPFRLNAGIGSVSDTVVPAPWFIRSPPLPPGYRHEPADIAGVTWLNYSLLRRSGSAPGEMISA
jgi:hypothetical protein